MRGIVQSGGTTDVEPLGGVPVTLCQGRRELAHAVTQRDGSFEIAHPGGATDEVFYLRAGDRSVMLLALLGTSLPDNVVINELTTVAAVYCAAQFLDAGGSIDGDPFALHIAAAMNANVVDVTTGTASIVLQSSPNGDETNAFRSAHALANLLASAVRSLPAREVLFELATPDGGARPKNTVAAMHAIARNPASHVKKLYAQSKVVEVYEPALREPPQAWTLAIKVNDSGSDEHMFGGPANLVFDRNGRAWITNNVVQGQTGSTEWSIVLDLDGTPAPFSPITAGGLLGPGFGVALDNAGEQVWFGNFGWGGVDPTPQGSVSVFALDGSPVTPSSGYQTSLYKVQGLALDTDGNVWMASYGSKAVVVYLGGDPDNAISFESTDDLTIEPFDVAIANDGTAWVTNSAKDSSGVMHFALANGQITLLQNIVAGQTVKGLVLDSLGNVWIASGGDSRVYAFDRDGNSLGTFDAGGLDGPWGITADGDDHLWAANFGPLKPFTDFHGRLTQLAGANPATRPPGLSLGDPISPSSGYTLPTAGDQVLLHDGTPLYGPDGPPCLIPMMRQTAAQIDGAGNVWTCNNWKPSFNTDITSNPGGDGIIIFLGLAKPASRASPMR